MADGDVICYGQKYRQHPPNEMYEVEGETGVRLRCSLCRSIVEVRDSPTADGHNHEPN